MLLRTLLLLHVDAMITGTTLSMRTYAAPIHGTALCNSRFYAESTTHTMICSVVVEARGYNPEGREFETR
jgi:hypothetical protein